MQKIKDTTRIEQEFLTDDDRTQLERDYDQVVKDCSQWEREERNRQSIEIHSHWFRRSGRTAQRMGSFIADWFFIILFFGSPVWAGVAGYLIVHLIEWWATGTWGFENNLPY